MKKLLLLIFILSALRAHAQVSYTPTKAFSLGFELPIPSNGVYSIGVGASAKLELPVVSRLAYHSQGALLPYFTKAICLTHPVHRARLHLSL